MLTIVTVIQLCCLVIFCGLQWSKVESLAVGELSAESPEVRCTSCVNRKESTGRHSRQNSRVGQSSLRTEPVITPDLVRHLQGRERKKQRRIFQILLDVNGIIGPGRNRSNISSSNMPADAKELQMDLKIRHKEDMKQNSNPSTRKTHTYLLPSCDPPDLNDGSRLSDTKNFRLFFNVAPPQRTIRMESVRITAANLLLRRKPLKKEIINGKFCGNEDKKFKNTNKNCPANPTDDWKVKINVYSKPNKVVKKALKTVRLNPRISSEWIKINIIKAVQGWYKTPVMNPGLQVTVFDGRNKPVDPFDVFHEINCDLSRNQTRAKEESNYGWEQTKATFGNGRANGTTATSPHIVVSAVAVPKTLEKRTQRHVTVKHNPCRKREVFISTQDLGPEWKDSIIAPAGFKSAVCEGSCSSCSVHISANATGNQRAYDRKGGDCCVPTGYAPLSALYFDNSTNVVYGQVNNAIVTRCGCHGH